MDYQPKLKQVRMHSDISAHSGMEEPQPQSSSIDSDKCSFSTSIEDMIQPELPHLESEDMIQPELPHLELEDMIQPELHHLEPTPAPLQTLPESESSFQPELDTAMIFEDNESSFQPELDPAMIFEDNDYIFEDYCEDDSPVDGNRLLYPNAPITLHQSFVSILTLAFSFKLTAQCLQAILNLIDLHCPNSGKVFKSTLYFFKKYFANIQGPREYEYYCSVCYQKCEKNGCVCVNSKVCYLVKLSLSSQLETVLNRKGVFSKLKFSNDGHIPGLFRDIYDGKLYQEQVKCAHLGRESFLSLQWYTDGAALYKSSNMSVWPLILTINELPFNERYLKENILVPVVWCGPVKPPSNLLMTSVFPDLKLLHKGVQLNVEGHGQKLVKALVLSGTGDTPARSLMMNMVAFNGKYACQRCEQEGVSRQNCPGVRFFPCDPNQMVPRTIHKMDKYANNSSSSNHIMGCKGPTVLSKVCPNFVAGTAIDAMHQTYGGAGKTVLKLLTSSVHASEKWSISAHTEMINRRLLDIRPPFHIPRQPRSLSDLAHWKISELKFFFNDASLPVLKGILPDNYLVHHATLVAAIKLLNADEVTQQSINVARDLLFKYVSTFVNLFDESFLTINFHLLLHLPDVVEDLGPLWVYSCFPLENINGVILSLVHGTRYAEKQIASSLQLCLSLPDIVTGLPNGDTKAFCKKLMTGTQRKSDGEVGDSIILGSCQKLEHIPPFISNFLQTSNIAASKVLTFHSLRKGKYIFDSSTKKSTLRDSSFVVYSENGCKQVGELQAFFRVFNCHCSTKCECNSKILAVISKHHVIQSFPTLLEGVCVPNVHQYIPTNTSTIVSDQSLICVCTRVTIDDSLYIAQPDNTKEKE